MFFALAVVATMGCGSSAATGPDGAVNATSARSLEDLDHDLATSCGGAESVSTCGPKSFCKTASTWTIGGCEALKANRRVLSDHFLKQLDAGVWQAAYPLTFLNVEIALPSLRGKLLASRDRDTLAGGGDPNKNDDALYPHQMAMLNAIETLSKESVVDYVSLKIEEREKLEGEAQGVDDNAAAARWLLDRVTHKRAAPP
jgi:hypothetical protein